MPILSIIIDKIAIFTPIIIDTMDKTLIKRLIVEYQRLPQEINFIKRDIALSNNLNYVLVGLRRSGKSYLLYQKINDLIADGHSRDEILLLNFEDERLLGIQLNDLDMILECYAEMYPHKPIVFLDELQVVAGWEHFARRLADQKYRVYITGSNAKMLSTEIAGSLGGRFMVKRIFPYSFREFLNAHGIQPEANWINSPQRHEIAREFTGYFQFGGLPELSDVEPPIRRQWLQNLFDKIFFGDILLRYNIRNASAVKILVKKLAESVKQPSSFTRLANIMSTVGAKISSETVADYLSYAKDSCLIFEIENYAAKIAERASNKKYYFADNGLLNLFLFDPTTSLLENIVALTLNQTGKETCFYHNGIEVGFLLWEDAHAIQVCYSMHKESTRNREIAALTALAQAMPLKQMTIVTYDEKESIETPAGIIEVIPVYEWMLRP